MNHWQLIWTSERSFLIRDESGPLAPIIADMIGTAVRGKLEAAARSIVPSSGGVHVELESSAASRMSLDTIKSHLNLISSESSTATRTPILHEVPVCYEESLGPDLEHVARMTGYSSADVIAMHLSREYSVISMGFLPGFGYLASLPEGLRVPRRDSPRTLVHCGSVGIAEDRTAVYPGESPGGWQIIGRSPQLMFHVDRTPPSRFQVGDRVRFKRISLDAFHQTLQRRKHGDTA